MSHPLIDTLLESGYVFADVDPVEVPDLEADLRAALEEFFDPSFVAERFGLPDVYRRFVGALERPLTAGNRHVIYYAGHLARATRIYLDDFRWALDDRRRAGQTLPNDTLWIPVGYWSDKHDWVLCCDTTHERFGCVLDVWDDHPWLSRHLTTYAEFPTFEAFVASEARGLGRI